MSNFEGVAGGDIFSELQVYISQCWLNKLHLHVIAYNCLYW